MARNFTLNKLDYFCDHTIKRYLEQVIRAFSGWQYESLPGVLHTVPCVSASHDPLVATLISNASDVTANQVPVIAVTITGIEMRRDDVQCPTHVSTVQVVERKIANGVYTSEQGRAYMVERLMPRPYALTFDIDVWTSNEDQKLQLLEQMLTVIGVDFQIQNSENALDWGAMTSMSLEGIEYSSAAGPVGTSTDRIDYFTLKMRVPIWLSAPAKVTQRKRIEQIVTNIYQGTITDGGAIEGSEMAQIIVTPGNHAISVSNNLITLKNSKSGEFDENGDLPDWAELVKLYGTLRPGFTKIDLSTTKNIEAVSTDIIGTVAFDPNNINVLQFTPNPASLPENTLDPVSGVINPRKAFPGQGLPGAVIGQRYLLLSGITGPTIGWGTLSAEPNDIIQFDGSHWTVDYRPAGGDADYITNSYTGRQLRWSRDGWVFTYDGLYRPGYWRLHI